MEEYNCAKVIKLRKKMTVNDCTYCAILLDDYIYYITIEIYRIEQ